MKTAIALSILAALGLCASACVGADDSSEGTDTAEEAALSSWSGVYKDADANPPVGHIYELLLRPNHTFDMQIQGEYGCSGYKGYDCPSDEDGKLGWTAVSGSWSGKAGAIVLQPKGDGTKESDPIDLSAKFASSKLDLAGKIGKRSVSGKLTVKARYSLSHDLKNSELTGTWKVTTPVDAQGWQPTLGGSKTYAQGLEHTVTFHASTHHVQEIVSGGGTSALMDGKFTVAGKATGTGEGVIVIETGGPIDTPVVTKYTGKELELRVNTNPTRTLTLERQ